MQNKILKGIVANVDLLKDAVFINDTAIADYKSTNLADFVVKLTMVGTKNLRVSIINKTHGLIDNQDFEFNELIDGFYDDKNETIGKLINSYVKMFN